MAPLGERKIHQVKKKLSIEMGTKNALFVIKTF